MDISSQVSSAIPTHSDGDSSAYVLGEPLRGELFVVVNDSDGSLSEIDHLLREQGQQVVSLNHKSNTKDLVRKVTRLTGGEKLDAIHILSHGKPGSIEIGEDVITGANRDQYVDQIKQLGRQLGDSGDLLIYGCEVGRGKNGHSLTDWLANIADADVATSSDITGTIRRQNFSDWDLEVVSGTIEAAGGSALARLPLENTTLALSTIGTIVAGSLIDYGITWLFDSVTGSQNIALEYPGNSPEVNVPPILTGITPGSQVASAYYLDTDGDLVNIQLTGGGTFSVALAGGLTNNADATSILLSGTTASSELSISVSPIELGINAGSILQGDNGLYNRMFSGGYTNIDVITSSSDRAGALASVELSAAIVNNIDLRSVEIQSITLDTGFATYVDRVNTSSLYNSMGIESNTNFNNNTIDGGTNNQAEIVDFAGVFDDQAPVTNGGGGYNPVSGLIDLGDITAKSIGRLIVNGSVSAATGDPYDRSDTTNDLRGEIEVTESIGSIEANLSRLNGNIKAGSIGSVDLGRIDGSITTTDSSQPLTIQLPYDYQGFITSAGHLNLAYTFEIVQNTTGSTAGGQANSTVGEIRSLNGISGVFPQEDDTIYIPESYTGVVINRSNSKPIADININGIGMSRWISHHDIGHITANAFTEAMIVEAKGDIGDIETYISQPVAVEEPPQPPEPPIVQALSGFFEAGGSIGNVKSATSVAADLRAISGSIGSITALTGGIDSNLIEANQSIGNLWAHQQDPSIPNSGKIVAKKGSIGNLFLGAGRWGSTLSAGLDIGKIYIEKGGLDMVTFAAGRTIDSLEVKGANAIVGGTFSAGLSIGDIKVVDSKGNAVSGALFQAGDEYGLYRFGSDGANVEIASIGDINVTAFGGTQLLPIEPGVETNPNINETNGIMDSQFIAGDIGSVRSRSFTGNGIVDTVLHAKKESIGVITGIANGDGLRRVNVNAQKNIDGVTGLSHMQGDGIFQSRFYANEGSLGIVSGRGGVAGGRGIYDTYTQSYLKSEGFDAIGNSNGGHAIELLTAHAGSFGNLSARIRGGEGTQLGNIVSNGITDSQFTSYEGDLESLTVSNNSINGLGIVGSIFDISGHVSDIDVKTFNATGIEATEITVEDDIERIKIVASHGGSGLSGSTLRSKKGSIGATSLNRAPGIVVTAGGTSPVDQGITGSSLTAYKDIGDIRVESSGGSAIAGSTFNADLDADTGGYTNIGDIGTIVVRNRGIHLADSSGIEGSSFSAANIGDVMVYIEEFRGGAGIQGSNFTARNAIYNPRNGAFDNTSTIGKIYIRNGSRTGNGIDSSNFIAGASGKIRSIDVDTTWKKLDQSDPFNRGASGKGIYLSSFRASSLDPDQAVMNGKIGKINIKTGRVTPTLIPPDILIPGSTAPNDQFTAAAAGIDLSYFAAYGGINSINVDAIGTGIFGSAFLANRDVANGPAGAFLSTVADVKPTGGIGSIRVKSNGRWASGVVLSALLGDHIGSVDIQARNGPLLPNPAPQALNSASSRMLSKPVKNQSNHGSANNQPILPIVRLISTALNTTGMNPALEIVSPQTLEQYTAKNLMRYAGQPLIEPIEPASSTISGAISSINPEARRPSNSAVSALPTIDLGYAPVSGSLFVATKKNIKDVSIVNLNEGSPFFGSFFFANRSYGPTSTISIARKNSLDPRLEAALLAAGFKHPNSFSRYLTAFSGVQIPGGNLPTPISPA